MGLDIVEVVMRCEEEFDIQLEDWRLEHMQTVGDLFELICEQLHIPFGKDLPTPNSGAGVSLVLAPPGGWTRDTVWSKLVEIVIQQLQVRPDEVIYMARFGDDLGAD
jgi:acyl carrier protein